MENVKQLAGCAILDNYGRILLLHRSLDDVSWWELPGGKIEQGEIAEAAALREIHEELGVSVQLVKTLGSAAFEMHDQPYNYTWFQAEITDGEPSVKELDKFDDLEYFEVEDLLSLSLSPNMQIFFEKIFSGEVSFA